MKMMKRGGIENNGIKIELRDQFEEEMKCFFLNINAYVGLHAQLAFFFQFSNC